MYFVVLGGNIFFLEWFILQELNVNQKNILGWILLMCVFVFEYCFIYGISCEDKKIIFVVIQVVRFFIVYGVEIQVIIVDGWVLLYVFGLYVDGCVYFEVIQFVCELLYVIFEMNILKLIMFLWNGLKEKN